MLQGLSEVRPSTHHEFWRMLQIMKKVRITWTKSTISHKESHRRTIQALGLRRLGHSVVKECTPQIEGMINSVSFLLAVEELTES